MTLLDLPPTPPRLVCGITPHSWGTHAPLGCILDMGHEGRLHQDRMGRTWELPQEFTPRTHHLDVVQRLVTLQLGTLDLLDRLAREMGDYRSVDLAHFERRRVTDTLISMGIADEDAPAPDGAA
jgi:hypothetical protein